MRVLQICNKPPFPPIDGGCIAMNNITEGLIDQDIHVDVISISTNKHPVITPLLPNDYLETTNFKHIKVDTEIKLKDAFINLFSNESYNIKRFISKKFKQLIIDRIDSAEYDIILLESLYVTPYIDLIKERTDAKIILRAHNVEHKIWERMQANTSNPIKKQYLKILTQRLTQYEKDVLGKLDAIVSISDLDKKTFINLGFQKSIFNIPVGYSFKDIQLNIPKEENSIFHIASMDWQPNQEAVKWFLEKCWNELSEIHPTCKFYLAGRSMPKWVLNLDYPNLHIVGEVASAKEFFLSKDLMIVPLLSGSGMRVKIIEGMALGKTIITTSIGAEGINCQHEKNIIIANSPSEFIQQISRCLTDKNYKDSIGLEAQRLISKEYSNEVLAERLVRFFEKIKEHNSSSEENTLLNF